MKTPAILLVASASALALPSAHGCSACACSLSTDHSLSASSAEAPWSATLRVEYFDQTDLRSGTSSFDASSVELPHEEELQKETRNRNVWLGLRRELSRGFFASAELPWHDRFHTTFAENTEALSTSKITGLGDLRVRGGWGGKSDTLVYSVTSGLKLPTGKTDQTFSDGPVAGEVLDRGLQLGTGTTDVLLGASLQGELAGKASWFADIGASQPLNFHDGFKPSPSLAVNVGIRYLATKSLSPSLQLNFRDEGREEGVNSDHDNSGGTFLYVAPGFTWTPSTPVQVFAYLQLPLHQNVNGLQLQPKWLLSSGVRWAF